MAIVPQTSQPFTSPVRFPGAGLPYEARTQLRASQAKLGGAAE